MKEELVILVDSFDGYSDLWPTFFLFFDKNWKDCPYKLKLVSNFKNYQGIETILIGEELSWSDRTYKAVLELNCEYVMLLLEDYFIGNKVNNNEIIRILNFMKHNDSRYFRLTNFPKSRNNKKKSDIFSIYEDEEYGVNLQASIWKKDFLLDVLKEVKGNAWQFELYFLKKTIESNHKPMQGCYGSVVDPLCIKNGVIKGKWYPSTLKYFGKSGIHIDTSKREILNLYEQIKYKLMIILKEHISYSLRKKMKKAATMLGVKFVSDI